MFGLFGRVAGNCCCPICRIVCPLGFVPATVAVMVCDGYKCSAAFVAGGRVMLVCGCGFEFCCGLGWL